MRNRKRWGVAGGLAALGTTLALVVGLGAGAGTAAVAAAPQNTAPPTITGTPQEGQKLTGHRGTWSGNVADYDDQWTRCDKDGGSCAAISGSGGTSYTVKNVDVGNTIRFKVFAKNADGTTTAVSVPTAVIKRRYRTAAEARVKRLRQSDQRRHPDRGSHIACPPPRRPGTGITEHRHVRHNQRHGPLPRRRLRRRRAGRTRSTSPPFLTTNSRFPTSSPPAPTAGRPCK